MTETGHAQGERMPSLKTLFQESWDALIHSFLQLFVVNVIGFVVSVVILILCILFLGIGIGVFSGDTTSLQSILSNLSVPLIILLVGIFVLSIILFVVITWVVFIATTLILDSSGKIGIGASIQKSFKFIIPTFIVGMLIAFLIYGALFLFIFPAILFMMLFLFVYYEIILNGKGVRASLNRSVLIVSRNFGPLFIRILVFYIVYLGVVLLIPELLYRIVPNISAFVAFVSFIVNLFIGWYYYAFFIVLYKHARVGLDHEEGGSITWMWIVSLIGWVLFILIIFFGWKFLSQYIDGQSFLPSGSQNTPKTVTYNTPTNPEAESLYNRSQELFTQMRNVSTDQDDGMIIAEISRLNDENISVLKQAITIEPNNPVLWYDLGNAYTWVSSTGTLEDGLMAYQKAEEIEPDNVLYINGVGDMLIRMGRYDDAILQFQKTFRLTDKSGFANLSVAEAYANLGIYETAREHYEEAIRIFEEQNSSGLFDDEILEAQKGVASLPQ